MNHSSNTVTINGWNRVAGVWLILVMLAVAGQLCAHGGFDHVIGTVVKVEQNILTVKTAKGNVDVRVNETTEITKSSRKAGIVDLKPGTRVVVDVPEGAKEKVAHSVKIGVTDAATHSTPK